MADVSITRKAFMKVSFAAAGAFAAGGVLSACSSSNEGSARAGTTGASE